MRYDNLLNNLKNQILILDIETASFDNFGKPINIKKNSKKYIENAIVRWVGCYSYKEDKVYLLDYKKDSEKILQLLKSHNVYVGHNIDDFDKPILENNGLLQTTDKYFTIDTQVILGKSNYKTKDGYNFKNKAHLMGYNLKKNSLRHMAKTMKVEVQKGDIDYKIFYKSDYTPDEEQEIKKYLKGDILATKQVFDKLWDFWKPFTEMLKIDYVRDFTWIRSSIASLTYKIACSLLNYDATYSDKKTKLEEMGGRVIMPKYEEVRNVWLCDFSSLYPHIFCMFNLFAESNYETVPGYVWHGNDIFEVKGYYNISTVHPLSEHVKKMLKERMRLKKEDKDNPMVYALKIFLNSLYGSVRSPIFEKTHTPNAGWDCCWLGQQIHKLTEKMMDDFGFETVYGDTDSLALVAKKEEYNNEDYLKNCLKKIIKKINDNVPFPVETFDINIEAFLKYVLFPFSEQPIQDPKTGENLKENNRLIKKRQGKKKNYLYICEEDETDVVKLKGLPIIKDNATALAAKIFEEVLEPLIIQNKRAKFSKKFLEDVVNDYLGESENLQLLAREFKVKNSDEYKCENQLQAQISSSYFNGSEGVIKLICNKKIGRAGVGNRYCSIGEAIDNKLKAEDLNLDKLWQELSPFIKEK